VFHRADDFGGWSGAVELAVMPSKESIVEITIIIARANFSRLRIYESLTLQE